MVSSRIVWIAALLGASGATAARAQQADMSFFVTSVGKGKGADLGGLEGADAHCAALAKAAGARKTTWRAYLSTTGPNFGPGVNARDRIGKGPWKNAKGVVVAKSVEDLHSDVNNINKQTALTDPHSPPRWRVNGLVANVPEFARAFACAPGQPMVREKVCTVW